MTSQFQEKRNHYMKGIDDLYSRLDQSDGVDNNILKDLENIRSQAAKEYLINNSRIEKGRLNQASDPIQIYTPGFDLLSERKNDLKEVNQEINDENRFNDDGQIYANQKAFKNDISKLEKIYQEKGPNVALASKWNEDNSSWDLKPAEKADVKQLLDYVNTDVFKFAPKEERDRSQEQTKNIERESKMSEDYFEPEPNKSTPIKKANSIEEINAAIEGKDVYTLQFNSQLTGPDDFMTVDRNHDAIGIGNSKSSNIKKAPDADTVLVKRKDLKSEISRLSKSGIVVNDIAGQKVGSLDDIKAFNKGLTHSREVTPTIQQPKKSRKRDKNGLSMVQRHIIDDGNKILREHGLGDLQMGYDGKTLRENEAEKNHKVAKPLEKKLTKGQIQTVYVANKKYLTAGRPDYMVLYNGLSTKLTREQKKNQKQQAQSKEQTPTRRTSHRRLQIKKNQNQNKNIDRGPKM